MAPLHHTGSVALLERPVRGRAATSFLTREVQEVPPRSELHWKDGFGVLMVPEENLQVPVPMASLRRLWYEPWWTVASQRAPPAPAPQGTPPDGARGANDLCG